MKKTAYTIILIICVVFCLLAVESQTTILVKGNAGFPSGSIHIEVKPVYYSSTITLTYNTVFPSYFGDTVWGRKWIVYNLDGGENVTVYDEYNDLKLYNGNVTLSGLSSGFHTLAICSRNGTFVWGTSSYEGWYDAEDTASFTIDLSGKSPAPTPTLAPTSKPTATPELIPTPTPTPEPESLPTSLVMASSVTLAVVLFGIGLLFYGIKRK